MSSKKKAAYAVGGISLLFGAVFLFANIGFESFGDQLPEDIEVKEKDAGSTDASSDVEAEPNQIKRP